MRTEIHSYESFGTVDGPGIRFIVFFQGCPMRCAYCHNPDTWLTGNGKTIDTEDILSEILKYRTYFKNGGGVTLSGGEPLLQMDAVISLCKRLKEYDIHTCIDTSGITYNKDNIEKFDELLKFTDLFLLDMKHIDDSKHQDLTGQSNKHTLAFAQYLSANEKPMWIRHVLVPGITSDEASLRRSKEFLNTLHTIEKIEVLPYHTMGIHKYDNLGIAYRLKGIQPPNDEEIALAKKILLEGKGSHEC